MISLIIPKMDLLDDKRRLLLLQNYAQFSSDQCLVDLPK